MTSGDFYAFLKQDYGTFVGYVCLGVVGITVFVLVLKSLLLLWCGVDFCVGERTRRRRSAAVDAAASSEQMARDEAMAFRMQGEMEEEERLRGLEAKRAVRRRKMKRALRDATKVVEDRDLVCDGDGQRMIRIPPRQGRCCDDEEEEGDGSGGPSPSPLDQDRNPKSKKGGERENRLRQRRRRRLEPASCAVCLAEYEPGDRVIWSPNATCIHVFHDDCILTWLSRGKKRCPCCRKFFVPLAKSAGVEEGKGRGGSGSAIGAGEVEVEAEAEAPLSTSAHSSSIASSGVMSGAEDRIPAEEAAGGGFQNDEDPEDVIVEEDDGALDTEEYLSERRASALSPPPSSSSPSSSPYSHGDRAAQQRAAPMSGALGPDRQRDGGTAAAPEVGGPVDGDGDLENMEEAIIATDNREEIMSERLGDPSLELPSLSSSPSSPPWSAEETITDGSEPISSPGADSRGHSVNENRAGRSENHEEDPEGGGGGGDVGTVADLGSTTGEGGSLTPLSRPAPTSAVPGNGALGEDPEGGGGGGGSCGVQIPESASGVPQIEHRIRPGDEVGGTVGAEEGAVRHCADALDQV